MKKKILSILFLFYQAFGFSQITSTFDTDADGWIFLDGGTSITVSHNSSNGNPGGYISATYSSSTGATSESWFAPAKYLGSQVIQSLGMNLRFDLQQSLAGTNSSFYGDVRIESGGLYLSYSFPTKPSTAPGWASYSLKLDETQGWRINTTSGALATRTQIIQALSNITSIEIRGTYITNGTYTSGIDNVILEQRTLDVSPTVTSFAPTNGRPGESITINGTGFGATVVQNEVYFGAMRATINSVSSNQINATIPIGASYGLITVINKTTGLVKQSEKPFIPLFDNGGRIIPASFSVKTDILLDPTTGNDVFGIAVGDLDGDGWNDVLASERIINSISIFRNLGNGGNVNESSFAPKFTLAGAGNEPGLRVADVDGDGKLDILACYEDGLMRFATYRNISTPGNLAFEPLELWAGVVYSGSLSTVVDVDGDGRLDLIGHHGAGSVNSDFWIAQNISTIGNIEFGGSKSYFTNTLDAGTGVSAGDLNNDGKPELIVSHAFGSSFSILENNSTPGTISLTNLGPISTGQYNRALQIADLNQDGKNDIVFKFNGTQDIRIRLNTNSGGPLALTDFNTEVVLVSDLGNYGGMSLADINGDGKVDIIASDEADIGIFENVFEGGVFDVNAFVPAYQFQGTGTTSYPTSPIAADFNGDSKPDIVVGVTNSNPVRLSFYENRNVIAPTISLNTISPLKGPIGSTVTITGDNFSSVPSENTVNFGGVTATVLTAAKTELTVLVPSGATLSLVSVTRDNLTARYHLPFVPTFGPGVIFDNTHFAPPVNFLLTTADYDVEVGDLNGDGKPDVVAEGQTNRAYSFLNTHTSGAISLSSLTANDTTSSTTSNPILVDIDEDGFPDILSANGLYRNISTNGKIDFMPLTNFSVGSNAAAADFNLDGKTDILAANGTNVSIAENRSARPESFVTGAYPTVSPNINYAKPATGGGTASADFDNDGWTDFVATNPGADNITVWRNNGEFRISTTQFTALPVIAVGDNPGRIYKGDLDVDGRMDLVIYYSVTTTSQFITVLHNQSTPGNILFNRVDYPIGAFATVAHISDLDGDGRPEILVTSESSDQFFILKNTSSLGTITASSFAAPFSTAVNNPRGLSSADLNLDGKPEIIISANPNSLLVYENLIPIGPTISISQQPTSTAVCSGETTSFTLTASGVNNITYQWQKFDGSTFNNVTNTGGYAGTTTNTLTINTTGNFGAGVYQCLINGDLAPDKLSNTVTLTLNTVPNAPTVTPASNCIPAAIALAASGGTNGQYRWYDVATGGTALAGQVNSSFTTPVITTTTNYFVALNNGLCESPRTQVTASIVPLTKPTATSSRPIVNNAINICDGEDVTLTAPAGFPTYAWSSGASTQQITINTTDSYSFTVTEASGCVSPSSDPITLTVNPYPLAEITANSTQLTASPGDSYQWYHNGNLVTGAISQTFEYNVLEYGVYAVDVTENGCTSTSSDFIYLITGFENPQHGFKIYPTPIETNLEVEFHPPYSVLVFSTTGRLLKQIESKISETSIDFSEITTGLYILQLKNEKGTFYQRVIKK